MFEFGTEGYRPLWSRGPGEVAREHGHRLRALAGRTLTCVWTVRDLRDDTWFPDCPVLLDFDGEQAEINHRRFDDLSVTWNTADPARPVHWPGGDFDLAWRPEPRPGAQALRGLPLDRVELLEEAGDGDDAAEGSVSVSFVFATGRVTVINALDENGLDFGPPDPRLRVHALG
ncbi:hypothetical protein [Streptomyces yaizuensis]|uniref:Uncharacterized protein n=1 Tax=Streptomyces yaizuensis TaxID=2989713 RepID=A0ABQ5NSH9_9ACTN|nr:hypothetical protein [Streptomyces sp. YSPA8]GLF93098.1 hypothetical protein SYYSPA8_02395 [Streptomyces sp. YSPA8]